MAKSFLVYLLIFSGFASKAQIDTYIYFKLTVQVKWLDTDEPLKGWNVTVEGNDESTIQYLTNESGYIFVDSTFLQPECNYIITVFNLDSSRATIQTQISTIDLSDPKEYFFVFKLRNIYCNFNPFPRVPPKD